jgi:phosphatidylglycerophosphate synthase
VITLSRLPIAIALTQTFGDRAWSAALVLLAAFTDAIDGTVARWMKHRGRGRSADIGGWLDPLVDKIFVVIVLGTIWWHTRDTVLIALIAAREILFAPLAIVYLVRRIPRSQLKARTIGKVATIAQFLACAVAVVEPTYAWPLAIVAAGAGIAAIVDYLVSSRVKRMAPASR